MEQLQENRQCRKWTQQEDERLIRQVRAFPHNLSKCFLTVSEEIGRTDKAVAAHWYQKLSKSERLQRDPLFFTASSRSISKNRKNSMGQESNPGIWRRLLTVLRSLGR